MPIFPANTHRFDPYKNFKFRVKWDGKVVAAVSKVSALKRTTEVGSTARATTRRPHGTCRPRSRSSRFRRARRPTDPEFEKWANGSTTSARPGPFAREVPQGPPPEFLNETATSPRSTRSSLLVSEYQALPSSRQRQRGRGSDDEDRERGLGARRVETGAAER